MKQTEYDKMQEGLDMAVVEELIRSESDGAISFGNHKLEKKAKVEEIGRAHV